MGASFSEPALKAKLKISIGRLNLLSKRRDNDVKVAKRAISGLLEDGKESNARIRAEAIIRDEKFIMAVDLLLLHVELVIQRLPMLSLQQSCPEDLLEPIASIGFCMSRIPATELTDICKQLSLRFSKEWMANISRDRAIVPERIYKNLDPVVPSSQDVTAVLVNIAEEFGLDWAPQVAESAPLQQYDEKEPEYYPVLIPPPIAAAPARPPSHTEKGAEGEDGGEDPTLDSLMDRFDQLKKK